MPRVGLFIADDVGLGKTIEAGLILREMLMRQKVRRVVISCPPSVVRQWQEEMESRFGLTFMILDREFIAARRQERGYGINPWMTHTRFIISHALLRDETYAAPLRDWLGDFAAASMLILDEAHNAAPASGAKYAVDSQLTKTVRDLAPRFEHKLFLSATPHNGHSNSFAALLEILDPQRFCRGVPVRNRKLLDTVMVRRLKQDLREIGEEFPQRYVLPIVIDNLPEDAPELKLSRLLQQYRNLREEKLKDAAKSTQTTAMLVITSLQKRLLSSIEAFARTLKVHRTGMEKQAAHRLFTHQASLPLLFESPGADDERAEFSEEEVQAEEDAQMAAASMQAAGQTARELAILDEMADVANSSRYQPDPRIQQLVEWIRQNLCPDLGQPNAAWLERRVIIFTNDPEIRLHKEWLGFLQPVGLVVSPPALSAAQAVVNRNVVELQQTLQEVARREPVSGDIGKKTFGIDDFPAFTINVLGWQPEDLVVSPESLAMAFRPPEAIALPDYNEVLTPTYAVPDPNGNWMMLVQVLPDGTELDNAGAEDSKSTGWHASPQSKFERLLKETKVYIGLLCNNTELRLVYAPLGESSGHLTFPVQAMCEVSGRLILGAMEMLLSADRLFNVPSDRRLSAILEKSRKYQNDVSIKLAEQVLEALWDLLRGFQIADATSKSRLVSDIATTAPQHIYGGLITILLRLVFLLYAEDRGLMSQDAVYTRYYSVSGLYERLREDAGNYPDTMDQRMRGQQMM